MVSRGGRSKGCSNCRRRRVKCDETRPICNRCKKRGLDCEGPKDSTWISQNNVFPSPPSDEVQLAQINLPADISFAAFEDDICLAYTRKNLLRGGAVELACDMIQFNNGVADSSSDPGTNLLRKAIFSLAITFFGSQHRQPKVTKRGYRQYGEVLHQMNMHLTIPVLQTSNETILTALTCMLLEIFLPTGPNNFLKHARGIQAMLEMRGPPSDATGITALIFHGLRILSIVASLVDSKPSIYSRDEWKRIPPIHKDEAGLLRHQLFEILADCTRLMSERDAVIAADQGPASYQPLLLELKMQLDKLKAVYSQWERYNESQMDEPMTKWARDIKVANHNSATVYMLYNTTYMCILQIVESMAPSTKNASLRNAAAIKIVRCLELKEFEKRIGAPESNTIGFVATKVAWQALGGFNSPEGRRLARIVKSAVNGVFAAGAWETRKEEKPRMNPESAEGVLFNNVWKAPMRISDFEPTTQQGLFQTDGMQREIIDIGYKQTSSPPPISIEPSYIVKELQEMAEYNMTPAVMSADARNGLTGRA